MEVDVLSKVGGKGKTGKNETCRVRGKLGHYARDCWNTADKVKGKGKSNSPATSSGSNGGTQLNATGAPKFTSQTCGVPQAHR